MKITKDNSQFGTKVILNGGDKYLTFSFGGNLDLYWSIHYKNINENGDNKYKYFIITKENYGIYRLFEDLFYDIESINFYEDEEYVPLYIETEEEKRIYLEEQRKEREEAKKMYRLYNRAHYNELFDKKRKIITWYSDETAHEVGNILRIKKKIDKYIIEFIIQPHMDGYDRDFYTNFYIPIRFRNSGSSYDPFNLIFMRMYKKMINIDDIMDFGHQMHIEEYLYQKKLVKKRRYNEGINNM